MTEPLITRTLAGLTYAWPSLSLTVRLSRIKEHGGEVRSELTALNGAGVLTQQSLNLLAGRTRGQLAKELQDKHPLTTPSWATLLEKVCVQSLHELRKGEPIITLQPSLETNVPFLLNPLIYQKHQTLIYAPGGSCKSYLALYLALLACHGAQQNDLRALSAPVLYLDWELDAETIGTRLTRLYRGHPELSQYAPYYRVCHQPLHEEIDLLAGEIQDRGVQLVIIDSAIMACGDDLNSTHAPKQLGRALRQLGCASVVLSHVAKNSEHKTAYGNVFFQNLCRNQYEVELVDEGANEKRITLTHRKANFGSFQPPKGLAFNFEDEACRVTAFDPLIEDEQPNECLPIPSRIRNLLEDGLPRSSAEICAALSLPPTQVRVALHRHDRKKWHKSAGGLWSVMSSSK